jgi:hypothetical protein
LTLQVKVGSLFFHKCGKEGSVVKKNFKIRIRTAIEQAGNPFGEDFCAGINGEKSTGPQF